MEVRDARKSPAVPRLRWVRERNERDRGAPALRDAAQANSKDCRGKADRFSGAYRDRNRARKARRRGAHQAPQDAARPRGFHLLEESNGEKKRRRGAQTAEYDRAPAARKKGYFPHYPDYRSRARRSPQWAP